MGRPARSFPSLSSGLIYELASVVFAVTALVVLVVVPLGTRVEAREVRVDPAGRTTELPQGEPEVRRTTLLEHEGAGVLRLLMVPVVIAAAPLAIRRRRRRSARIASAALLCAFVVVGASSVGVSYLPAAVLMIDAAAQRDAAGAPAGRS